MSGKSLYIGHGAPFNAIWETTYKNNLKKFGIQNEKPKAILVVSAHWERRIPMQITSSPHPGIIYDFYGFPEEMYKLEYNSPGDPKLAEKIAMQLKKNGWDTLQNPSQGLDHGAWIPLMIMYPDADIPVLQLSIPIPRNPLELFNIGKSLSSLREEGIMLLGSGNITHNLPHVFNQIRMGKFEMNGWEKASIESWAQETDGYIKEKLDDSKFSDLINKYQNIPNIQKAAPTTEHLDPLYFVLGSLDEKEGISYIHEGFEAGSISMRSFVSEA